MSYEIEGEPTWNCHEPEKYIYMSGNMELAYLYSCGDMIIFEIGPGYSISPTRTPWASWWRPTYTFINSHPDQWRNNPCTHWYRAKKFIELIDYEPGCDAFHGPCECGAWLKENPQ